MSTKSATTLPPVNQKTPDTDYNPSKCKSLLVEVAAATATVVATSALALGYFAFSYKEVRALAAAATSISLVATHDIFEMATGIKTPISVGQDETRVNFINSVTTAAYQIYSIPFGGDFEDTGNLVEHKPLNSTSL